MTSYTTNEIKKYSTDTQKSNALLALTNYYHKNSFDKISGEQALAFLEKLKKGEVNLNEV